MQENKFIAKLNQTAQLQAKFPISHNQFSTFFWQHAWRIWLTVAFFSALIFEFWWGRC